MTVRLSIINFAGIARTEVAVGTEREASMLCTTRAATPRIVSTVAAPGVTSVGIGLTTGSAGVDTGAFAGSSAADGGFAGAGFTGLFTVVAFVIVGAGVAGVAGVAGITEAAGALVEERGCAAFVCAAFVCADFGSGGVPPRGAVLKGGRVAEGRA